MKHFPCIFRSGVIALAVIAFLQIQAVRSDPYNGFDISRSIIPASEIHHGGPLRDGIPALTDPAFEKAEEATWLDDDARILGISVNGTAKAYPLKILNLHEIVNDRFGDDYIVITYCPLCFSGMAFNARLDGERHLFGVSGLLYNSDVLLYDHKTESLWTQIGARAISGRYVNRELRQIPVDNTTWKKWRSEHPSTVVLSRDTGYLRDYTKDPYASYRDSPETMFPVSFRASGYHPKEPVIGITINNQPMAYPVSELSRTSGSIEDTVGGEKIYINFDIHHQSGKILDRHCNRLPSVMMYWFAWYTFHPDTEIFRNSSVEQNPQHGCLD